MAIKALQLSAIAFLCCTCFSQTFEDILIGEIRALNRRITEMNTEFSAKFEELKNGQELLQGSQDNATERVSGQLEELQGCSSQDSLLETFAGILEFERDLQKDLLSRTCNVDQITEPQTLFSTEFRRTEESTQVRSSLEQPINLAVLATDECAEGTHSCSPHATCNDSITNYTCHCLPGYSGDGFTCEDVDECSTGDNRCHDHAQCNNTVGNYSCVCQEGYSGDGFTCEDVNECSTGDSRCHSRAQCTNTEGSYICTCNDGYSGSGFTCEDVNECSTGGNSCHYRAQCTNTEGSYRCTCNDGYSGSGFSCGDVNECSTGANSCHYRARCTNTAGSYRCTCNDGYSGSGFSCGDVNECSTGANSCHYQAKCTNTAGSYRCTCKDGYSGSGYSCERETSGGTMEYHSDDHSHTHDYLCDHCHVPG